MSKIAFISDLHLDAVTGGVKRFDDVTGFLADTLEWVDYDAIVFCGDLCDPDSVDAWASVAAFSQFVNNWQGEDRSIWLIPGNHDVVEDGRGTTVLDQIQAATVPEIVTICNLSVALLPYTARAKAYDPGGYVESWGQTGIDIDLFVGHLNVEGHGPGSETTDMARGREVFWPLEEIAKHYPKALCIGGHYHAACDIRFDAAGPHASRVGFGKNWLHIVGAPARFTFGEEKNSPSYSVLDTDTMQLTRVPIPNRQVVTIDRLDMVGIENGAIVRIRRDAYGNGDELDAFGKKLVEERGASIIIDGQLNRFMAPVEAVKFGGEVFEDGVAAAKRLAEEWPVAEAEFRAELVGLVDTIAEEEA